METKSAGTHILGKSEDFHTLKKHICILLVGISCYVVLLLQGVKMCMEVCIENLSSKRGGWCK